MSSSHLPVTFSILAAFSLSIWASYGCNTDGGSPSAEAGTGSGGAGGAAPNSCPPVLVNMGSGPGIICQEMTGDSCADSEQFCECGDETIEGRPWICVPTQGSCPEELPEAGASCSAAESCDYVVEGVRTTCSCEDGSFTCETSACPIQRPLNDESCAGNQGLECSFFVAASPARPNSAHNLECTCGTNDRWSCDDGCPETFPGQGATCDTEGPINCSWLDGDRLLYCGCNGTWNCT